MNDDTSDQDFIAEALPVFISEANEQIQALEQLLLELEAKPDDSELLNALFRCAHTVKGSAGIFGLQDVVGFTHHVETLLDRLREGQVVLSPALSTLLLESNDQIRLLVAAAAHPQDEDAASRDLRGEIVARLQLAAGASVQAVVGPAVESTTTGSVDGARRWHVSVCFGADTFRNGMDPMAVLNYVRGLGAVPILSCDTAAVPALDAIDGESCHLAFEFALDTPARREEIEAAFSFVREDCTLRLVEPGASAEALVALIAAIPERPRLGEILMSVGAISRAQLAEGLQQQARQEDREGRAAPLGEVLQNSVGINPRVIAAALQKQRGGTVAAPATANDDNRFIRVHADRLDEVINLLGELVIAGAGASLLARQTRQSGLIEANQHMTRLIEDIRNGTLQLRMVPIGETFARFRRVVRDTAAELGKDVVLEIVGGDTELDKSVVERIADPLMHLVRNSLDHGLETTQERQASGKAAQAKLTLSACHESGNILIRIIDNGRGIQRDKVLERAWQRGLVEQGTVPPDADILRLIFEPGFSTAEKVTNLSGRGVGMDVVRRNIEALRGSVSLASEPGEGSSVEIRLPLTLAIIDGFLVGVGASKFIFPLDAVVEVIERKPTDPGFDARGRGCVELRGQVLPVVSLRALYDLAPQDGESGRGSVVVLRHGAQVFGVLVDALLGQYQTVIKPLGRMFLSLRGMSGSSILGSGEVALIFDVPSLNQLAEFEPARPPTTSRRSIDTRATVITSHQGSAS